MNWRQGIRRDSFFGSYVPRETSRGGHRQPGVEPNERRGSGADLQCRGVPVDIPQEEKREQTKAGVVPEGGESVHSRRLGQVAGPVEDRRTERERAHLASSSWMLSTRDWQYEMISEIMNA